MDTECLEHLLTEEERATFGRDGLMVVENALPDSMVKDLNKAMDRVGGGVDFIGKDDLFLELIGQRCFQRYSGFSGGTFIFITRLHLRDPRILRRNFARKRVLRGIRTATG